MGPNFPRKIGQKFDAFSEFFSKNHPYLILIKFTVFIRRFSFILKGYNDKTDEYINHEESDDNDVDKVKASYYWSIIMDWAHVFLV